MACGHNCGCKDCSNHSHGLGAYGVVPPLAQHGFRLSIPGGPRGGQFHGRVSANATDLAYHGGRAANMTGRPSAYMIDPFHRAPGELAPRPNAAGDLNVTGVDHEKISPGFSMVPGGLFPPSSMGIGWLGAKAPLPVTRSTTPLHSVIPPEPIIKSYPPVRPPLHLPSGPFPVNGKCPSGYHSAPLPDCPPFAMCISTCQPNQITVNPPSGQPAPAPTTPITCAPGQFQDAAGNCITQQSYPYPISPAPQPSPTVPADTSGTPSAGQPGCISGQFDASGNCITSTVPGTTSWFTDPSQELISGVPNWGLLVGGGVLAYLMFGQKGKR